MGLSEQIGEMYSGIEDKFYSAMDFLSDKGIPVYSIIDPLEDRGIPAFPVIIATTLLVLFLTYGFMFLITSETSLILSIKDEKGAGVNGVMVKLLDDNDKQIKLGSTTFSDGQVVIVPRGKGTRLTIEATKTDYEDFAGVILLKSEEQDVTIQMNRIVVYLEGALRLVDAETSDLISGAIITAMFSDSAGGTCTESSKGIYTCPGLISGKETTLKIEHPNYEQTNLDTTFVSDSPSEIQLVPKASATIGKTNLIVRTFDSETRERIGNFTLKIFDAVDNEIITEIKETDDDGEMIEKISKGTTVRIVVEKEDYITYDSSVVEENILLRSEEEKRDVYLKPGTNALIATVIDITGRPLTSIEVLLFNEFGELIDTKTTGFSGEVVFENLSTDRVYFVSAWSDKHVPAVEEILLSEGNRINLLMNPATANNSGSLTVYTTDEDSVALNDVTLNFYEDSEDRGLLPLGIPAQKTDITGKYSILAPLNAKVYIEATKEGLEGEASVTIIDTFKNEAFITLREPFSQVRLRILDKDGHEVGEGLLSIIAGNEILYEGAYEQGGILFNPEKNKYVSLTYTDEEGNVLEEELFVEGLDEVTVNPLGKTSMGTNPEIEFQGIYNIDGSEANGLAKDIDYFLKFRVFFPEGTNSNGIHVRLGEDSIKFVDSQDAGIVGYSASGANSFYGRSYAPLPSPGFEGIDYFNSGKEGKYNKFIELYFTSGGEKIVKIRAKAKKTSSTSEIPLHYRAWSTIGNLIYRTPEDAELGLEEYSENKTSLYSETMSEQIKILEESASCLNELCASYQFVRSDGSEFSIDNFKAVLGSVYALEINLSPDEGSSVTIKASTVKKKPKIGFQGFTINDYTNYPDSNSTDTSIQVNNVSAIEGETTSVRVYFKPSQTENSSITMQLISGETVINEQFYFEIYEEKNLVLATIPQNVVLGEDFVMVVQDVDKKAIENAEIILSNSNGEHLETIQGNESVNKGGNGRYLTQNSFDAGTLHYEVNAERFKPLSGTIEITKEGIIKWLEDEVFVQIRKDQVNAERFLELENSSKQNVQELVFEVNPVGAVPAGMRINVTPFSTLPGNSTQRVIVSAEYTGDNETAHGEAVVTAKGRTETGFTVLAETRVIVDYNEKISPKCVEFSKKKLVVYIASGADNRNYYDGLYNSSGGFNNYSNTYGSGYQPSPSSASRYNNYYSPNNSNFYGSGTNYNNYGTGSNNYSGNNYYGGYANNSSSRYYDFSTATTVNFTAKLANLPECQGLEIELKPQVFSNAKQTQGLEIEAETIRLSPNISQGETEARRDLDEVTISVSNSMIRNYSGKQKYKFDIIFKSDDYQKTILLEVYIWNPRYALQVNRNIELFLGPNDRGMFAAQAPLFVRNVGEADIENVRFSVSSTTGTNNVRLKIVPQFGIQFLQKGQTILPPKTLVAEALRNEKTTLVDVQELDISGVIDGQTFSFGPIIVTSHISSDQCLVAVTSNVLYQSLKSSEGAISRDIKLKNTCAEEVRIIDVSQPPIGNNQLTLVPANVFLPPGATKEFQLILTKKEDFQGSPVPVYVKGFLPRSGSPIDSSPIIVDVKLGKTALTDTKTAERQSIKVCETGEARDIYFPIIASETNPSCDTAYCDAVQLSKYLAGRLDMQVKDAQKQILGYQGLVQPNICSNDTLLRGFCTFQDIGVQTDSFTVYMSHDSLSPELMNMALKERTGTISGYTTTFLARDIGGEYLGGYSRQILLNDNFMGCGRYNVNLRGSVRVQSSRYVPDLMNIVIDITPENDEELVSQLTDQCLPKIQNLTNFLPVDKGLTLSSKQGAWIGAIETESELLEFSKSIAKNMFGSEERTRETVNGANILRISYSNDVDALVKVKMDKTLSSTNPKTINAYIRKGLGTNEELQAKIIKESIDAISGLRENVIDGCISDDESTFLIKGKSGFDKPVLKIKEDETIKVLYKTPSCIEIGVTSIVKDNVSLSAKQASGFDGLKGEPFFYELEENDLTSSLEIDKLNDDGIYEGKARVCVEGSKELHKAQGKKIQVFVQREEGNPVEGSVTLQVCGIHPVDFLDDIKTLDPAKDYYATFVWKGEPGTIKINSLDKLNRVNDALDVAKEILTNNGRGITSSDSEPVKKAKRNAANAYLAACGLTSAGTSLLRGPVGWVAGVINILVDCGLPYYGMIGDSIPIVSNIFESLEVVIEPLQKALDWVAEKAGTFLKWTADMGIGAINYGLRVFGTEKVTNEEGTETTQPKFKLPTLDELRKGTKEAAGKSPENIIGAFVPAMAIKDSILGAQRIFRTGTINKGQISSISANIADNVTKEFSQNAFNGASNSFTKKLKNEIEKNVNESISEAMKTKSRFGRKAISLTNSEVLEAAKSGISKSGKGDNLLKAYAKVRGSVSAGSSIAEAKISAEILDEVGNKVNTVGTSDKFVKNFNKTNIGNEAAILRSVDSKITKGLRENAIRSYQEAIGYSGKLPRDLIKELEKVKITSFEPSKVGKGIYSIKVADSAQKEALESMNTIFRNYTERTIRDEAGFGGLSNAVKSKFNAKLAPLINSSVGSLDPKNLRAGLGLGNFRRFLGSALREGIFGLAANAAGLYMYDKVLTFETNKIDNSPEILTREKELGDTKARLYGTAIRGDEIDILIKYQTYSVDVTMPAPDSKIIMLGLVDKIPEKSETMNECDGSYFNKEAGEVLLGFIPKTKNKDNFPEFFQTSKQLELKHVEIAENYMKPHEYGKRFGVIIAEAVAEEKQEFYEDTGLNLEALVTAMGIVKSGLGTDEKLGSNIMFGCDKDNRLNATPLENANCATEELYSYREEDSCYENIQCYYTKYSENDKNQKSNLFSNIKPEDFEDIYKTWAGYGFTADVS